MLAASLSSVYGYLINKNFQFTTENIICIWNIERQEPTGAKEYMCIEAIGLKSTSDYTIIGNNIQFNTWANQYNDFKPQVQPFL